MVDNIVRCINIGNVRNFFVEFGKSFDKSIDRDNLSLLLKELLHSMNTEQYERRTSQAHVSNIMFDLKATGSVFADVSLLNPIVNTDKSGKDCCINSVALDVSSTFTLSPFLRSST